jgi:hypothetical protein
MGNSAKNPDLAVPASDLAIFMGTSLRARTGFFNHTSNLFAVLRLWLRQHFAATGKVLRLRLAASTASDQRDHVVVGTGSAIRPITPLLVCAGSWRDRSDDRATLDGLKLFRLARAWISDRAQLGSFSPKSEPDRLVRCTDRCPSPPGFPRVPLQRRSRCSARRWDVLVFRPLFCRVERIDTAISSDCLTAAEGHSRQNAL